jgi:hypothetical protein
MSDEQCYCGFSVREMRIPGLRPGVVAGADTQRLTLSDKAGVKWEIRPMTFREEEGKRLPASLSLYHRSKQGPMHYQGYAKPATHDGVQRLLRYIRWHEQYEKTGISGRIRRKP